MSNYTGGRLPRHNPNLHGSSRSLWDVKSRLSDTPKNKFATIYSSSVSLSPSGNSATGAERRPKKSFPYGLAARNRIRSLARFRFASSCDNVAAARHYPFTDKDRRHTVYSARNGQRHSGQLLSSVPSEGNLFINVRFNTLNGPQKVGRGQRSFSTSTLINSQPERQHINVVGILAGKSVCGIKNA